MVESVIRECFHLHKALKPFASSSSSREAGKVPFIDQKLNREIFRRCECMGRWFLIMHNFIVASSSVKWREVGTHNACPAKVHGIKWNLPNFSVLQFSFRCLVLHAHRILATPRLCEWPALNLYCSVSDTFPDRVRKWKFSIENEGEIAFPVVASFRFQFQGSGKVVFGRRWCWWLAENRKKVNSICGCSSLAKIFPIHEHQRKLEKRFSLSSPKKETFLVNGCGKRCCFGGFRFLLALFRDTTASLPEVPKLPSLIFSANCHHINPKPSCLCRLIKGFSEKVKSKFGCVIICLLMYSGISKKNRIKSRTHKSSGNIKGLNPRAVVAFCCSPIFGSNAVLLLRRPYIGEVRFVSTNTCTRQRTLKP